MKNNKPVAFLIICMIIGLFLFLYFSISSINRDRQTKHYLETTGTFASAEISEKKDKKSNTTYYLNYEYVVGDITYYYKTDYSTSFIPKEGSEVTIKYNPENPTESYATGFANSSIFQLLGIIFFFIPLIILCNKEITKVTNIFIFCMLIIIYSI